MAVINETLRLRDRFSATFGKYLAQTKRASKATQELTSMMHRVAGAVVSVRGAQQILNMADAVSQTTARLNRMNDGLQTTAELNNMIYQSAQRSRGAYQDTADMVAKLGTLAGDAFNSTAETVAFAEQLNKQIALSGASAQGAQAAMLQLTQAMSSGTLRGEELNSILEQTPTIAQAIAKYMGVSIGEMRELASEGQVTANVVKNAMFAAAEETNAAFESMPKTWGQIWTGMKNNALMAFQPVLQKISDLANSPEMQALQQQITMVVSQIANVVMIAVDILGSFLNFISSNFSTVMAVATVALTIFAAQMLVSAAAAAMANLPLILLIGIIVAVIMGLQAMGMTSEEIFTGIGMMVGWLYAFCYNIVADLWNLLAVFGEFFAGFLDNPVAAIGHLIADLADWVLSVLETLASGMDALFGSNMAGAVSGWRDSVQAWADNTFGAKTISLPRMEKISFTDAMGNFGKAFGDFGKGLDNFDLGGILKGTDASGMNAISSVSPYIGGAGAGGAGGSGGGGGKLGRDVADIKKEVTMSDEELKSLVDLAERKYVNNINLTAQTPVINITGQNTGNSKDDRKALANAIRDMLLEQQAAASLRSTARVT